MNRAICLVLAGGSRRLLIGIDVGHDAGHWRRGFRRFGRGLVPIGRLVRRLDTFGHCARTGHAFRRIAGRGIRPLPARRWHLGRFVLMVRIARGTARLLHLVVDHHHDDVIRDAALARTVVIQNVTEPKPALLH